MVYCYILLRGNAKITLEISVSEHFMTTLRQSTVPYTESETVIPAAELILLGYWQLHAGALLIVPENIFGRLRKISKIGFRLNANSTIASGEKHLKSSIVN